jgi:penicillin-binding protein 1B
MTHMMQDVINEGTGVRVRSMGFTYPAAGKTGTSRDGWFAGYTTNLLAIAWVGFDDNRELNLEGSRSALPIWTEFMLDAYELYPVRQGQRVRFYDPPGIEMASVDPTTMFLATPYCTETEERAFISGTTPTGFCPIHSLPGSSLFSRAVRGIGRALGSIF